VRETEIPIITARINVDKPGIYKISKRKYYCYQDGNYVLVVIPMWYRIAAAWVVPITMAWGFLPGWWFL